MPTILIVDDLATNRRYLIRLLRDQGHKLVEAANGIEALAAVQAEHPDLVITDVLMPAMDGYEFLRRLRLDLTTSEIPVLLHTAPYGEREARAFALSDGASYVLTKPASPDELFTLVSRALARQPASVTPRNESEPRRAIDREHLRLLSNELSENAGDLRAANARLRALINVGLELGSERDPDRLLQSVCTAAHDLFGATYVTLGIVDLNDQTVERVVTCGDDASGWLMKAGDTVSGMLRTVVTERRTLRGDNPTGDPAGLQLPALHPRVQAFLTAPVVSPAHVYGWFCLVGNDGTAFSEDDEHLVTALAGQLGRIYESASFAADAEKRAMELEHQIVERELAEAALRQERDRAQAYLETAEVFLLKLDLEGRVTLVNRYACSVLERTADELLGRDWVQTCLPPRTRDEFARRFQNLVNGDLSIGENPVLTRSGEERMIEWRNTLLRDDDQRVIGTFSSGTDITDRNEAVIALRTAEERMRFALEAAGVGIWDMDYTTGVLQWSPILEAQYGIAPGAFGGTMDAFSDGVHPDDREATLGMLADAARSGTDFSVTHRVVWPDGTVRWLSGAGRMRLGVDGEPVRGVGISFDITEQRTLEEQYRQAQKMEAIGRLAGGVAHDFNNLLTAILGYCELLLADLDTTDPRHADIVEIQKAGKSGAGLTRQLLAFSRKQIIQPSLLDVSAVVTGMRALLGRLIGEDIKVVMVLRPDLELVMADRGQVEQIVMNLAVNARDAMPGGGTLTIETANVELDDGYAKSHLAVKPGRYVVLTVSDSGTGMTPEVQARVFEPFFTTKDPGMGTGLGLATVHGIITRSGGSVNVYSELGRGTSFKVYFPRSSTAEVVSAAALPSDSLRDGGTETVLVVEDADGLRQLARRLLTRQGYKVLIASNAHEALQLFERNPSIDVLLTDVVMPGASGPDLSRQLVARRPGLRVIYMSGYTEDAIVHHGVLKPGIAFLHKPFTSETLGRKIRETLDRKGLEQKTEG